MMSGIADLIMTTNQQIEKARKGAATSAAVCLFFIMLTFLVCIANWHTLTATHKDWGTFTNALLVLAEVGIAASKLRDTVINILRWRELLAEKYASK